MTDRAFTLTDNQALLAQTVEPYPSYWRVVWRRIKQHRVAYVGFFFFMFLLFLVVAGPYMVPYALEPKLSQRNG